VLLRCVALRRVELTRASIVDFHTKVDERLDNFDTVSSRVQHSAREKGCVSSLDL